ncbi:MAG: type IV toxin-antitoxin system AbiEi family antitoxin domain-containing protein, partial [Acidimicrobiales bacterium]
MGAMHAISLTPDQRADRLASRQHGLLTRRQALACGLTEHQIEHRLRSGRWQLLAPGVYVVAGAPRCWRQHALAAVLAGRADARASHLTALALHGLGRPPTLPHVIVPHGASTRSRLANVHRSDLPCIDHANIDGIPCTSASRAIVDSASLLDRFALESAVDDALCSGRASPESVRSALERAGRKGRRGTGLLLAVLEVWTDDIRPGSAAEVRFLRRLAEWGVDDAATQLRTADEAGRFVARVDVASCSRRRIWEYDSDRFHNPAAGSVTRIGTRGSSRSVGASTMPPSVICSRARLESPSRWRREGRALHPPMRGVAHT